MCGSSTAPSTLQSGPEEAPQRFLHCKCNEHCFSQNFVVCECLLFCFTQELLESISPKMVEWDTNSLQLVEKETAIPSMSPLLHDSEDEGHSPEPTSDWIQRDAEDAEGEILPEAAADTPLNIQPTNIQSSPFVFSSGYTTMEMFQQGVPQPSSVNTQTVAQATDSDAAVVPAATVKRSGLDYVRQFSTSPVLGSDMTRCPDDILTDMDWDWRTQKTQVYQRNLCSTVYSITGFCSCVLSDILVLHYCTSVLVVSHTDHCGC